MTTISAQIFQLPSAERLSGAGPAVLSVTSGQGPGSAGAALKSGQPAYSRSVITNQMVSELKSLSSALSNTARGISVVQTAEAGHTTIVDLVKQMRDMAKAMSAATPTNADRTNAQTELSQLRDLISQTVSTTTMNGQILLDGQFFREIQLGTANRDLLPVAFGSHKPSDFPVSQTVARLDISTKAGAQTADSVLADALVYLDGQGISIRATADRLSGTADMLTRSSQMASQMYERALSPEGAAAGKQDRARLFDEAATSFLSRIRASSNLLPILLD